MQEVVDLGLVQGLPMYATGKYDADFVPIEKSSDLDAELQKCPNTPPVLATPINFTDKLLYIYTSGSEIVAVGYDTIVRI